MNLLKLSQQVKAVVWFLNILQKLRFIISRNIECATCLPIDVNMCAQDCWNSIVYMQKGLGGTISNCDTSLYSAVCKLYIIVGCVLWWTVGSLVFYVRMRALTKIISVVFALATNARNSTYHCKSPTAKMFVRNNTYIVSKTKPSMAWH